MKTNLLIVIGLIILLSVILTAIGIWHMSQTAEIQRKDTPATSVKPDPTPTP